VNAVQVHLAANPSLRNDADNNSSSEHPIDAV
jgi:hypothetical protein